MIFTKTYTVAEIASFLGRDFTGDGSLPVTGINEIHFVQQGDIAFVDHPKYFRKTLDSAATLILISEAAECPPGKALIVCDAPFAEFNKLLARHWPEPQAELRIAADAQIGHDTVIDPTAFVGPGAVIGNNCHIKASAVIGAGSIIGDRVIVHANATIGGDAFYYKKTEKGYQKLMSCGHVRLGNDVEIGASTTIDRGVTGATIVGNGTKIDNLVHIGHDTHVGERCLFAAQVGVAGCVVIEDDVVLWGQVGCIANVTIGRGAVVLAQSGIAKSLEGGKVYFGSPAVEARRKMKEIAATGRLVL